MIGILRKIFGAPEPITLESLKSALKEAERDRRKSRVEVRRWERERKKLVEKMKTSRNEGNQLEVDYLWDQFKQHRIEGVEIRRDGRVFNLEALALGRTVRALERLEKKKDRDGARALIERIRSSGLPERIALDRDEQMRSLEEMSQILEEFTGEREEEAADPEKAMFLAELDSIQEVERQGEAEEAKERESELLRRFEEDPEA